MNRKSASSIIGETRSEPCWSQLEEREFEEAIARFEQAWYEKPPESLEPFLPESPRLRPAVLRELIAIDREFRTNRGESLVGDYLSRYPELSAVPTSNDSGTDSADPRTVVLGPAGSITVNQLYTHPRHHARGGLGEILVVDDERLGRRVAVKRLQEKWITNPRAVTDFLQEAELTSCLEHPGIVPVHGLGQTSDGRPCYSMRFVEGQTLWQAIRDCYGESETDATQRVTRFRSLLTSFVVVCNTIAYAHSRGVLHRDLKPENVMLGPFGETLVLDWGMAKRNGRLRNEPPTEMEGKSTRTTVDTSAETVDGLGETCPLPSTPSGSRDLRTVAGQFLGTPAYMSPEQALGNHAQVGAATDIFGLGAMLYAILTGEAPYRAASVEGSLECARRRQLVSPLERRAGVPAPLSAICLMAMAAEPEQRYVTPLALAQDIEQWLAGEPVSAMREPWWEQARRHLRRRRTTLAVLSALALVMPIAVAIGGWMIAQERAESEIAHRTAAIRGEAARQVTEYLTRTFETADPIPTDHFGFRASEAGPPDATFRRMLDSGAELLRSHLTDQPELRAQLLLSIGNSYRGLADYPRARAALEESYQIRVAHYGPTAAESLQGKHYLARLTHDEGDYETAETMYRQVIEGRERLVPPQPLAIAETKEQLAWLLFYQPFGQKLPQFDSASVEESVRLFDEVVASREAVLPPNDQAIGLALAGRAAAKLCLPDQTQASTLDSARAMEIFRQANKNHALGNVMVRYFEAERLRRELRFHDADVIYREILEQSRASLGDHHPSVVIHLWNMAGMYRKMGDTSSADRTLTDIRSALRQLPSLRSHPAQIDALIQYGDALKLINDKRSQEVFAEALEYARERPEANQKYIEMLVQRLGT